MSKNDFFSLRFENDSLTFLVQTKLPLEEKYFSTDDYLRISEAIKRLEIRGAPAIGVAAAFALALSQLHENNSEKFYQAYETLLNSRPTAVNLKWAINRIKFLYEKIIDEKNVYHDLLAEAKAIHEEDINFCNRIAENGLKIFSKKYKRFDSLQHRRACNRR